MSSPRAKGQVQADGVSRLWWSVKEYAAATGLALDTVYRQMGRGDLAWEWMGGEKRIPNVELENRLASALARKKESA